MPMAIIDPLTVMEQVILKDLERQKTTRWTSHQAVQLHNDTPTDNINFIFHVDGHLKTTYNFINKTYDLSAGKHYIVSAPEGGFFNIIEAESSIQVLHLCLEKQYFTQLLEIDDPWSSQTLNLKEKGQSFTGFPFLLDITPEMWLLIQKIQSGTASNLRRQAWALELIALQIEQIQAELSPSAYVMSTEDIHKLKELKDYLERHFLDDTSLLQLSRICGLNEFKLKKNFKFLFKTTVFGYIRMLKMEHAIQLLRQNMPVANVAYELGYEYPQHFSTAFKSYAGVNPSNFIPT